MRIFARQIDIAGIGRGQMAADRRAEAVLRAIDNRLAVDGIGYGAANAHIVERLLPVVDGEDRLALRAADQHFETRVALKLRDGVEIAKARKRVEIAPQQSCDLRGRVID